MIWGLEDEQKVAIGDYVKLHCGVIIYNYTSEIVWRKDGDVIEDIDGRNVEENNTKFSWRKSVTFKSISKDDSGVYECEVIPKDTDASPERILISIKVQDTQAPEITTNFNESVITHAVGDSFTLECIVKGLPVPSLLWYKDDNIFVISEHNAERINFDATNSTVYFKVLIPDDAANYKCVAWNRVGSEHKSVVLEIPSESQAN
jgi:Immunoglobulin domain